MTEQSGADVLAPTLGHRLRRARERAGLDQFELAARIGASRGTIGNYEHNRGIRPPKVYVLRDWAKACGVSYDELVAGFQDQLDPQPRAQAGERASTGTTQAAVTSERDDRTSHTHWFVSSRLRFRSSRNVTSDQTSVAQAA